MVIATGSRPLCLVGLSPQTKTSLFCVLCTYSYAPGSNFPVGHPSSNRSKAKHA